MKTIHTLPLAAALALAASASHAMDMKAAMELAKASGCYSCHADGEKIVGPAYKDIAAKYKDDKDAVATLVQSIQYGSKGKYGRIPMPPHASLSADDLKTLASYVLTIK